MSQVDSTGYLRLFGGPKLVLKDGPISLSPYQACLLGLAYGNGDSGVSRAEASWLLWEAEDAPPARHRISQLLYGLKRKADVTCIEEGAGGVLRGNLPSDTSDLLDRIELRDLSSLRAAAEREFLCEIEPPTAAYAHWIDARRATLRKLLRETLANELSAAENASNWRKARAAAEILLTLDPANEDTLRTLLRACALSGSRAEVDAAMRSYGESYLVKVGERWSPERATIELLRRIDAPERRLSVASGAPAFVGRAAESKKLFDALVTPASEVRFAIVAGEAGIGKTRLIRESIARLRLAGVTVLEAGGSLLRRDLPLDSMIGALSHERAVAKLKALEEPWRSSLRRLLPGVIPDDHADLPVLDPQATSRRLMESIYQLLGAITADGPTVLFLDDLQWLDKTTLCVLEFLCERTPAIGLNVVLGFRDDPEQDSNVRSFLDVAKKRGTWILLGELDSVAANSLLDAAPRRLEKSEREKLVEVGAGNPFFLIELVSDYCQGEGRVPGQRPGERVPSSVKQLISSRLEALSHDGRTLLQLLGVIGDLRTETDLMSEGLPLEHLADVADDLLRARLIEHDAGTLRVRHDLIRQATYDLMGPVKRTLLHKRAAQLVLGRLGDAGSGEAAIHFDRSGDRQAAYEHAVRAADAAREGGAVEEAIRFWEVARRNADKPASVQSAIESQAELLYDARRLDQAVPLLEASVAGANNQSVPRFSLMLLDVLSELPGADQLSCLHGAREIADGALAEEDWTRHLEAVEVQLRILDRLGDENGIRKELGRLRELDSSDVALSPHARCLLKLMLALSVFYADAAFGLQAAKLALGIAQEHDIGRLLLRAYHRNLYCRSLRAEIHTPEGWDTVQRALACAARGGDMRAKANIYIIVGVYYIGMSDYERAEQSFLESEKLASAPSERVMVNCNLGILYKTQGDHERGEARFHAAKLEAQSRAIHGGANLIVQSGLGLCALATGRIALAEEAERIVRQEMVRGNRVHSMVIEFLAELERRRGRYEAALALVREHLSVDQSLPVAWIFTKHLEAKYLRLVDRDAGDKLLAEVREEARRYGIEPD